MSCKKIVQILDISVYKSTQMHLLPTAQYLRLQISFICQISVTCQITVICYDAKVKSRKRRVSLYRLLTPICCYDADTISRVRIRSFLAWHHLRI